MWEGRAKRRYVFSCCDGHLSVTTARNTASHYFASRLTLALNFRALLYLVGGVVRARLLHLHQDEGVQEVGGDHVGDERRGLFLEHHRHDVISYVAFPLELKENLNVLQHVTLLEPRYRKMFVSRLQCTRDSLYP